MNDLSTREREVLWFIGQGQTVSAIARTLELSAKTVSEYRRRVCKKLNLHSTPALIRHAILEELMDESRVVVDLTGDPPLAPDDPRRGGGL